MVETRRHLDDIARLSRIKGSLQVEIVILGKGGMAGSDVEQDQTGQQNYDVTLHNCLSFEYVYATILIMLTANILTHGYEQMLNNLRKEI